MGHKVNPISFRLGINKTPLSLWYANKKTTASYACEDFLIRQLIYARLEDFFVDNIFIKRIGESTTVIVNCTKNLNLSKDGQGAKERLQDEIEKKINRKIVLQTTIIRNRELSAKYQAYNIANQLSRDFFYKRVIRRSVESMMSSGAMGCKVLLSGRLGGNEMSRIEKQYDGVMPLHSISSFIDYSKRDAKTSAGIIGVKVWINKGSALVRKNLSSKKRYVYSKGDEVS
jgi:small subunit ribosomal protein S3